MNFGLLSVAIAAAVFSTDAGSIDHDKVEPFAYPEPVTISEQAASKFQPRIQFDEDACFAYPAVNAAGETNAGLRPTGGNKGYKDSGLGSQIDGRAGWHNDVWAIMYAWYFPKSFYDAKPDHRHDWASAVVWIDNPAVETPKELGLSLSISDSETSKVAPISFPRDDEGTRLKYDLAPGKYAELIDIQWPYGATYDLIVWEQLTEAARVALNSSSSFGRADVPFSDTNFRKWLEKAWPFE